MGKPPSRLYMLLDKWNDLPDTSRVKVGVVKAGSAINCVGLPDTGMYFDVGKRRKEMEKHADHIDPKIIKGVPDLLNDPIAITEY